MFAGTSVQVWLANCEQELAALEVSHLSRHISRNAVKFTYQTRSKVMQTIDHSFLL